MTEEQAAEASRLEKPMIVYVYDDSKNEDARFAVEKDLAFQTEEVAVGARFFDCARMDLASAKADRVLRTKVKRAGLFFVRPNLEVAAVISNKFKSKAIFSTMCKTLKKDYKNCAATVLKKQRTLNKERLKIDKDRVKVVQLDEKMDKIKSSKKRQRLQRERDKIEESLADRTTKLDEKEAKLYELTLKKTT